MSPAPELVLGPPGTGKTTALIAEVEAELARGTPPGSIGYISFTRRAAEEAATRTVADLGLPLDEVPYFRTIHSLCYRQLGLQRGDLLLGERLQEFAQWAGVELTGRWNDDGTLQGFTEGDRLLFMENLARLRCMDLRELYDQDDDGLSWRRLLHFSRSLAAFKKARGLVDYTDMLAGFLDAGVPPPLDVLVVDEAQDLSPLQWSVVAKVAASCRRLVVAGDDDQAIYRWAGADAAHLVGMQGTPRVLGQSYRVPRAIQAVASGIIGQVAHRREKAWAPRAAEGRVDRAAGIDQVDLGAGSVLVLARNNYILAQQVAPELRAQGIIYELAGRPSLDPTVMAAVTTWERLRRGHPASAAEVRVSYGFLTPGRGVEREHAALPMARDDEPLTLGDLRGQHGLLTEAPWFEALGRLPRDDVSYIRAARARGEKVVGRPRVTLSTIHGSKGGEADHVVLMTEVAQRTWREIERWPEDEARVWYVGVTRARERLTVVDSQTPRCCPWL